MIECPTVSYTIPFPCAGVDKEPDVEPVLAGQENDPAVSLAHSDWMRSARRGPGWMNNHCTVPPKVYAWNRVSALSAGDGLCWRRASPIWIPI